jgi:hypothetical protein
MGFSNPAQRSTIFADDAAMRHSEVRALVRKGSRTPTTIYEREDARHTVGVLACIWPGMTLAQGCPCRREVAARTGVGLRSGSRRELPERRSPASPYSRRWARRSTMAGFINFLRTARQPLPRRPALNRTLTAVPAACGCAVAVALACGAGLASPTGGASTTVTGFTLSEACCFK